MKFTKSQIFGLLILFAATIFFIVMGMITASKAIIEIDNLAVLTGKVEEIGLIEIKTGRVGATHTSLFFRIKGTSTLFGVTHNNDEEYQKYFDEIKVDDEVRILYDTITLLRDDEINFGVYQLEKSDKILLNIEDVRDKEKTITYVLYGFAAFMMLLTAFVYFSIRKKNNQAAS